MRYVSVTLYEGAKSTISAAREHLQEALRRYNANDPNHEARNIFVGRALGELDLAHNRLLPFLEILHEEADPDVLQRQIDEYRQITENQADSIEALKDRIKTLEGVKADEVRRLQEEELSQLKVMRDNLEYERAALSRENEALQAKTACYDSMLSDLHQCHDTMRSVEQLLLEQDSDGPVTCSLRDIRQQLLDVLHEQTSAKQE